MGPGLAFRPTFSGRDIEMLSTLLPPVRKRLTPCSMWAAGVRFRLLQSVELLPLSIVSPDWGTLHRIYQEPYHGVYFKPIVSSTMDSVGVTRDFKKLMKDYSKIPFVDSYHIDLDDYVTEKALDGLFQMVGAEEKKIRKNPVARTTELLKKVFSE